MTRFIHHLLLAIVALFLGSDLGRAQTFYISSANGTIDRVTSAGSISTWATGGNNFFNLAVDGNGALYVEQLNGTILKYGSPASSAVNVTFASGAQSLAIASDSAGNIYQANLSAGNIVTYNSSGTQIQSFAASGLTSPRSIALDSAGNIYAANYSAATITKYSTAGSLLNTFTIASAPAFQGLTVNGAGSMFVTSGGKVYEISASGTVTTFYSGGVQLYGLTFVGDNLYVVTANQSVLEISSSGTATTFATGLDSGSQWIAVVVPEPASGMLLGVAGLFFFFMRRKQEAMS